MKALLKRNKKWVDIETQYVFDNQYNTANGRIFDNEIVRIYDDVRIPRLTEFRSVYNGKFFKTEEEFKNYCDENRRKYETKENCLNCFYCQKRKINEKKTIEKENNNGVYKETVTETYELEPYCSYKYEDKCELLAPERYGIVHPWVNAYFVKNPYGNLFNKQEEETYYLKASWYVKIKGFDFELYNSRKRFLGTYTKHDSDIIVTWERLDFPKTKIFGIVVNLMRDMLKYHLNKIRDFNKNVMSSWQYRQPDYTLLEEVEVNGEKIKRPEPFIQTTFQLEELLYDLDFNLQDFDCFKTKTINEIIEDSLELNLLIKSIKDKTLF